MPTQMIDNPEVQLVLDRYDEPTREKLLQLRQLILDVAAATAGVGEIEETLKWGQISYLTHNPKSGTTIRMDTYEGETQQIALFVHCQTSLVQTFQQMYPAHFVYEGNRALIWDDLNDERIHVLKHFIQLALTYHQHKAG